MIINILLGAVFTAPVYAESRYKVPVLIPVDAQDSAQSTQYRVLNGTLGENLAGVSTSETYRLKGGLGHVITFQSPDGKINVTGVVKHEHEVAVSVSIIPENEEDNPDYEPVSVPGLVTPQGPDVEFLSPGVVLIQGQNKLTAHATDDVGNEAFETISVVLDLVAPGRPRVFTVPSRTPLSTQTIEGAKDTRTSILLDGVEIVPLDAATTWNYEVTLPQEGTNTFRFKAQDEAGNFSPEAIVSIIRDSEAPTLRVLSPLDGATVSEAEIAILGTIDDDAAALATSPVARGRVRIAQGNFVVERVPLSVGSNTVTVTADTGLTQSTVTFTVIYDDLSPNPAAPVVQGVQTPTREATQSIAGTKPADTALWANGIQAGSVLPTTTWTFPVSSAHGTNLYTFQVSDAVGRMSDAAVAEVLLDTTPPTRPLVSAFSLAPEEGTGLVRLHGTWSSADPETQVVGYSCAVSPSPAGDGVTFEPLVPPGATSIDKPGLNLEQGNTYYLLVKATNEVGLESPIGVSRGVFINRNEPRVDSAGVADYSKKHWAIPIAVTVTASDPDGDPLEYRFTWDGTVIQNWSASQTATVRLAAQDFGSHLLSVEARDPFNGLAFKGVRLYVTGPPPAP